MIRRFNANIPYNGLTYSTPSEGFFSDNNKGRLIVNCLETVLDEAYPPDDPESVLKIEAQLACLHRLFASKSGKDSCFRQFSEVAETHTENSTKCGCIFFRF